MPSQKFLKKRDELLSIEAKIETLEVSKAELESWLQENCDHSSFIETPQESSSFGSARSPRKICIICGIEEDRWHCGYKLMQGDPLKEVDRDTFYTYRKLAPIEQDTRFVPKTETAPV